MVGWVHFEAGIRRTKTEVIRPQGLSLLSVALPPGKAARRAGQGGRILRKDGVTRALVPPELEEPLAHFGVAPVSPLPLCRRLGDRLCLKLLERVPLRQRRAALRGETVTPAAWAAAERLCPQVGALLLDFDRGEGELNAHLHRLYGIPPLHLGQGAPPQAAVEFSPRDRSLPDTLKLWGEPDLGGLTLQGPEAMPELPRLPFLELLWETGRLRAEDVAIL